MALESGRKLEVAEAPDAALYIGSIADELSRLASLRAMTSNRWLTSSTWRGSKPMRFASFGAGRRIARQADQADTHLLAHADAVEESAARVAVGDQAVTLLQVAHRVAQIEIEMPVEIRDFVAERREPALQRDALVA